MNWKKRARCTEVDPEMFYPTRPGDDVDYDNADAAMQVCWGVDEDGRITQGECPVRMQCLNTALDDDEREGIWGGTTPSMRRKIHRRAW